MEYGACVDISTEEDARVICECQLGRILNPETNECDIPRPTTPTPRPIPTLAPGVKTATTAVTKSASTILVVCVLITLFLFGSMRIFDVARVIQMNMEIALVMAHIILLIPSLHEHPDVSNIIDRVEIQRNMTR